MLKTVKLKTLFLMNFKPSHLQFIIIHFSQSVFTPRISLAVAENLKNSNSSDLYDTNESLSAEVSYELKKCLKEVYTIIVQTFEIFYILLKDNWSLNSSNKKVTKIYLILADYAKSNYDPSKNEIKETNIFLKNTKKIVKFFRKKLHEESTTKSFNKNYACISLLIEIIEVYFIVSCFFLNFVILKFQIILA